MGRLEGKVAIVVGGGQTPGETVGNGRATCLRFVKSVRGWLLSIVRLTRRGNR